VGENVTCAFYPTKHEVLEGSGALRYGQVGPKSSKDEANKNPHGTRWSQSRLR
jgi:hypothetical protein